MAFRHPLDADDIGDGDRPFAELGPLSGHGVEHRLELALRIADHAYVLETGRLALEGPAAELHENDHVRRAYLGG